ncbi:hypothetical protein AB0395_25910 [Streptosporangium sp. NPDC051023]|uniref:hypothetical protein n=1 Tax=Streptosporangium sp. NPDC051023 TaxID=3155410 RepID=UPI003450EF9A
MVGVVGAVEGEVTQGGELGLDPVEPRAGATGGVYGRAEAAGVPVIAMNSEGPGVKAGVWWEINLCDSPRAPFKRAVDQGINSEKCVRKSLKEECRDS